MRLALAWAGLCVVLTGCVGSEAITLRNQAGASVQCGPYGSTVFVEARLLAEDQLRNCVMDYQRQGYERTGR